jgi:hypothetical protein
MPTRARETYPDILRNRTPVGGSTEVLSVKFENGHVIGFAEESCTPDDSLQHVLKFGGRSTDDLQNLCCRRLLFECLGKVLPRLCEFAGSLVELLLQVGCRGAATARSRCVLAALDLRRLTAVRSHSYATRRPAGLASGHAANAIDVTSRHPLMKALR